MLLVASLGPGACRRVDAPKQTEQSRMPSAEQQAEPSKAAHSAIGSLDELPPEHRPLFTDDSDFEAVPSPSPGDWLAEHPEPGQSFDQLVSRRPNRPDATRGIVYLQPLGSFQNSRYLAFQLIGRHIMNLSLA